MVEKKLHVNFAILRTLNLTMSLHSTMFKNQRGVAEDTKTHQGTQDHLMCNIG